MGTFNCPHFIAEFAAFVAGLDCRDKLEVGSRTGELANVVGAVGIDIAPIGPGVLKGDIRTWRPSEPYDLVYSSGVLEHYSPEEAVNIIRHMARCSRGYVLNYVPNTDCASYRSNKAETGAAWRDELDYTPDSLAELHEQAGLKVAKKGLAAAQWAKRFGAEPSGPYLVWVLAQVVKG